MPDSNPMLVAQSWMPSEFVGTTAKRSLTDFRGEFAEYSFLLVRLTETSGPLAIALERASTLPGSEMPASDEISYTTVFYRPTESAGPPEPRSGDGEHIAPELTREPHFIVPIRSRQWEQSEPQDRIWVGRAHNNDIVLRHRTVSKCHAWFVYDDDRRLFVKDARSRNETKVNERSIGQESVELQSGDRIGFGSVQTQLCSADALWRTLSR